jgi:hypothetical protein
MHRFQFENGSFLAFEIEFHHMWPPIDFAFLCFPFWRAMEREIPQTFLLYLLRTTQFGILQARERISKWPVSGNSHQINHVVQTIEKR